MRLSMLELSPEMLGQQWFLCVFVSSLPSETTCRIWDCVLTMGPEVLFSIGLATVQAFERSIKTSNIDTSEMFLALRAFEHSLSLIHI